ncbi:hypothetical protein SAMN05444141_11329 [Pseudovibrio denitrificans]|uniref:Uncharacterized protein n=1 Tax=Pseudovibrio denitrificans TaxID=258256 RepID=A0A1I7DYR0_9HYPH|nr:hypothetical protein [Pseudovibrio denitrificans]SFU16783.1 hypothetical protein SAMN05444141_11329 [Pseudovibrio denitrificans]
MKSYCLNTALILRDHAAQLQNGLVRSEDWERLQFLAKMFPQFCHAGFEVPLGESSPGADFLICLRRQKESGHLLNIVSPDENWRRLRRFALKWREGRNFLDCIPNCWLEFDLLQMKTDGHLEPSLFVNVPVKAVNKYADVIDQLADLLSFPVSRACRDEAGRVVKIIAPHADAIETGFWLSRPTTGLRLVFMKLRRSPEQLIALLAEAGHPNPAALNSASLSSLWPVGGSIALALDIQENISLNIGIELYASPAGKPIDLADDLDNKFRLLTSLRDTGLCTASKMKNILGWQGTRSYGEAPELEGEVCLYRSLNHVKLSLSSKEQLPSAKAYLALTALAYRKRETQHAFA